MIELSSSRAPLSPGARLRAAEVLLRSRADEIVAAVVRQAEAGDRGAMRLARRYALPLAPAPAVLAVRLAASIARTRATVAMLLAEGGGAVGRSSRRRDAPHDPDTAHPVGVRHAPKEAATLVNNKENTSGTTDGDDERHS